MEPSWHAVLADELAQPYFRDLAARIGADGRRGAVYPPAAQVFRALAAAPFDRVSVVIVGQDPYHGPGQAHGLAFSVPDGVPAPRSLVNIFKELEEDPEVEFSRPGPGRGNLEAWARQGVLLLNTVLTVRGGEALSHRDMGWERLTDAALGRLAARREGLVFLLWGAAAQAKAALVPPGRGHVVLRAAHPSPLSASRGFFGCGHFSLANAALRELGRPEIDWRL